MISEEGTYYIRRVKALPVRGSSNILYSIRSEGFKNFYRWLSNGEYEVLSLGLPEAPIDGSQYARKGAGWEKVVVSDGEGALVVYKTVDESITSDITLSLDTDLQVTLEASSYYRIEISIMRTSNILADFAISFTVPTSSQGGYRRSISDSDVLFDITSASANPLNSVSSTSLERVILFGWIKTTNTGTFGLNWTQKTSHFTATTLKEGSYIILNKLN